MTLSEAREDLLAQSRLDVDLYKGVELDADGNQILEAEGATDLLSKACVWWAKQTYCSYEPSVTWTLAVGTATYDGRDRDIFSKRILRPRTVTINGTTLRRRDGRQYGLWTMEEFQRYYPEFRTASNDVPYLAVWLPTNKFILHNPPAALYAGTNFVEGWTIPDALVNGADDNVELPVPEEDHPAVVRLAIAFGSLPNISEQEAWARMQANDVWWKDQAERRKRENLNAFLGRRPRGSRPDWMYS